MIQHFFAILAKIDGIYWAYIGFLLLVGTGFYFSYKSGFYQIRVISHLPATIRTLMAYSKKELPGISPIRLYFASIGGMIGLGNIVGVITALLIGGPGALFWLWVAVFAGMIIKYAEIYLGMKYRKPNKTRGYDGGLFYCIPHAFKGKLGSILATLSAILLCIYGVEVFQFTVIADTIHNSIPLLHRELIILPLLAFTLYIGLGGIKRLANLCTYMMPIFIILYTILCLWVIATHYTLIPDLIVSIFKSAFVGQAPIGGFAGSTLIMAAQQGTARAVYSGDIAIGFDSIIQSESKINHPQQQARLAILSSISDGIVCTLSILVVMVTGLWKEPEALKASEYVAHSLSLYIPYADSLITIIIFLAGFTTIQAYFAVGIKSAKFLSPSKGKPIYFAYAIFGFWFFAHYDQVKVLIIMSLSGGLLILINLICILKLKHEVSFDLLKKDSLLK